MPDRARLRRNAPGPVVAAAAATYAQTILAETGLVGYWRLGEPSGTNAADATAANDGTYVNTPTLAVAGAIAADADTAVTFDAASFERVLITAVPLAATDNYTLECWVKAASWTGNMSAIGVGTGTNGYQMWFQGGVPRGLTGNGGGMTDGASALSTGLWYHVVLRRSSGVNTVWVNGTQYDPGTNNTDGGTTPTTRTCIGCYDAANYFFNGTIDEPALYNAALPDARIAAHYAFHA